MPCAYICGLLLPGPSITTGWRPVGDTMASDDAAVSATCLYAVDLELPGGLQLSVQCPAHTSVACCCLAPPSPLGWRSTGNTMASDDAIVFLAGLYLVDLEQPRGLQLVPAGIDAAVMPQAALLFCMHPLPAALPSVAHIPCYSGRHNGLTWLTKHTLLSETMGTHGSSSAATQGCCHQIPPWSCSASGAVSAV